MDTLLKVHLCCSVTELCSTLCEPMDCSTPGFPVLHHLPKFAQTHVHRWCRSTISVSAISFSFCPLSIFSSIRVFSNELALHIRWSKYWSFSISPSNEYSGSISFKIDRFDLLAVCGTRKSLLQHHSLKASVLRRSASCMVQLSHPHMTTGKTIAVTIRTLVGNVMSPFLIRCLGLS